MKFLNLYAGLGGNRKKIKGVNCTAVELNPLISNVYAKYNPDDTVINCDAHEYLLKNYSHFDFVWSSPPCQRNTKMIRSGRNRTASYPDLRLYEEILFLTHNFKGLWVVENVEPYYKPLIAPKIKIGRHLFWSNFDIEPFTAPKIENFINAQNKRAKEALQDWLGIHYAENIYYEKNHCLTQVLRNCVHPDVGEHVFNSGLFSQFF